MVQVSVASEALLRDAMAQGIAEVDRAKFPGCDTRAQEASLTLIRTYGTLNDLIDDFLAVFGLSRARLHTLAFLNNSPDGEMRMTDIGRWLHVTKAYVTNLIDGLEREGLVERVPSARDRRAVVTRITPAGRTRLHEVLPSHLNRLRDLWAGLTEDELQMLVHLLAKARIELIAASGSDSGETLPV
ncbi:MAG TPA: MarR family transcriptional regulator [Chloroflexota bacterium]|nr:MarR family transcriptional regulator [Chloroflexota bacterium]